MDLKLKVWRQDSPKSKGTLKSYSLSQVSPDMSFLEMLDVLNEKLVHENKEPPIEFDHDCREGICGMCSLVINGEPHGPDKGITTCQLHMRRFKSGDTIVVEPFRARAFPVVRDLVVDRSAFDRIVAHGKGYVSVNTGSAVEANTHPVPKSAADTAFLAAACIGCGACVAACKNASASLFVAAKVAHLYHLPQGKTEHLPRAAAMVAQMDKEQFGSCTNTHACQAACPKDISVRHIAELNRHRAHAALKGP